MLPIAKCMALPGSSLRESLSMGTRSGTEGVRGGVCVCRGVQPAPWQMYLLSQGRVHFFHMPWTLQLNTYPRLILKAKRPLMRPDSAPPPARPGAMGSREQ